jgi:type IV secretion system protein TrbL
VIVAIDFPDPFGLLGAGGELFGMARDAVLGPVGDVLLEQFQKMFSALVGWVLEAVVSLSVAILGFFWDAAEPDVGATWFSGGSSTPYGSMVVMAAPLLAVCFLAGVIQGVVKGDVAGMTRMALVRLPGSCLAMVMTVAVTHLLLRVTDGMSEAVFVGFQDDIEAMAEMIAPLAATPGIAPFAQLLVLIFASVGLLAAMAVLLELFVRAGLIYIVVALSPFIYAAAVWESMRGGVRKMAEIGFALILSKFVIAVALALSATAMTSMWEASGTELPTPEQAAAGSEGWTAIVGILLSSIVMFAVAAFMPFVLFKLLPVAEAATVAAGVKSSPVRGAQQAHHVAMMGRHNPAARVLRQGRSGGQPSVPGNGGGRAGKGPAAGGRGTAGATAGAGAGSGGAAAGAAGAGAGSGVAAAGAAAGPVGVVVAGGAAAAKKGAAQARSAAARSADQATSTGGDTGSERAARRSPPRSQGGRPRGSGGGRG